MLQLMFYAKIIDRSEFIFSHFEIIKSFKVLHVNIYFYFIYFELYTAKLHSNLWFAFKYRKWRNVFKYKKSPVKKFFSYPLYDSNKRFVLLYRFLKSAKKCKQVGISFGGNYHLPQRVPIQNIHAIFSFLIIDY